MLNKGVFNMKRFSKFTFTLFLIMFFVFSSSSFIAHAADDTIDERFGEPAVVYGETLTDEQKEEVRRLLEVDTDQVNEFTVTGQDLSNYIGGNPNSRMFSSAKITHKEDGHGIVVNIVTADNITEVTNDMYSNALLTAGVENALIEVASPVQVTGHSALSGIYKAYDAEGAELDKDRMEVANEELDVATELSEREDLDEDKVSELIAEIKKELADKKPESKEDIENIIDEILIKLEISLSDKDRELLLNLFDKMREIDIDFDKVKDQLEDIASKIQDKVSDINIEIDEGAWQKFLQFLKGIIESILDIFQSNSSKG